MQFFLDGIGRFVCVCVHWFCDDTFESDPPCRKFESFAAQESHVSCIALPEVGSMSSVDGTFVLYLNETCTYHGLSAIANSLVCNYLLQRRLD